MKVDFKSFTQKYQKPRKDLFPVGTRVYKGFQGSGKTLSMVKYAFDVQKQFPNAYIFSNIKIRGLNNYYHINDDNVLLDALALQRGAEGVLILLDEAHLFFNKKTGISLDVLTAISQQRKDRKRLVFSSQIWEELDISLRKQVKEIVSCFCRFGKLQINHVSDGETLTYDKLQSTWIARPLYTEVFKHYQALYDSYDTFQKIVKNTQYTRQPSSPPPAFQFVMPQKK